MDIAETTKLCGLLAGSIPHQKFDETTPAFWHGLLSDLTYADCVQAVMRLVKRQRFVGVNDICDEVALIRSARTKREVDTLEPNVDPDNELAYRLELRAIYAAAADGTLDIERYQLGGFTLTGAPPWRGQHQLGLGTPDPERLLSIIESGIQFPRSVDAERERTAIEKAAHERAEAERARQLAALDEMAQRGADRMTEDAAADLRDRRSS